MADNRVTRRTKQGRVDVDYEDSALIVNYEIETVEVDHRGNVVEVLERKPEIRRLKIRQLTADRNMAQLANDIIDKCKYIHTSRAEEIETLLIKLKKHHLANPRSAAESVPEAKAEERPSPVREATQGNGRRTEDRRDDRRVTEESRRPKGDGLPPAEMVALDDYLEMLYQVSGKTDKEKEDGLRAQERGTALILKLCREVMNLEQLIQNSTVMGAVTRVLQEEYKKSIELTFNILRIFLAFSNFLEMHALMANYRIGVLTMKAIDFEVKRSELRDAERVAREAQLNESLVGAVDYPKALEAAKRTREREAAQHRQFVSKQDRVLFVGFYILLNLAEDATVERKMIKKGLLPSLLAMLCRSYEQLLVLAVTFLRKLSVFEENKEALKEAGLVDLLGKFVPCASADLVMAALRLLFNLSFDQGLRDQMLKAGFVPKLVNLLKTPMFRAKTLRLLYHLSVDDRCKSMLAHTEGIPMLMGLVLNFPGDLLAKELAALMINLSYFPRNVELMLNNKGLNLLVDRFADKRDVLLMKIIRNISLWTFGQQQDASSELSYRYRGLWSPHVKVLLEIMLEPATSGSNSSNSNGSSGNHDLVIEIAGCLANMTSADLPATASWARLLRDGGLLSFCSRMLVPGLAANDLVLEVIMLIATMASDAAACDLLASGNLIAALYAQLKDKGEGDVEILLQAFNAFHRLLLFQASREAVLYSTRLFGDIVDALDHRSAAVRAKADAMSEIVLEYDRKPSGELGALGSQVLKRRFEAHNKAWLQAMGGSAALLSQGDDYYYDDGGRGMTSMGSTDRLVAGDDHDVSMIAGRYMGGDDEAGREGGWKAGAEYDDDDQLDEDDEYDQRMHMRGSSSTWHK